MVASGVRGPRLGHSNIQMLSSLGQKVVELMEPEVKHLCSIKIIFAIPSVEELPQINR